MELPGDGAGGGCGGDAGPTAGTDGIVHNIPAQTPPWIRQWQRWPAYTTVTFDDPGLVEYSDSYVSGLLPMMSAKKVRYRLRW